MHECLLLIIIVGPAKAIVIIGVLYRTLCA